MRVFRYPVEMSSNPRRELLWEIQKLLHLLNEEQLYNIAVSLEDEREVDIPAVTGSNEPELFEYLVGYMKSDQLMDLEDHGLSRLLIIRDEIEELTINKNQHAPALDSVSSDNEVRGGPTVTEQVPGLVRLTDVAAFLPRREFKMHGGVISDSGSEMSYSSVCKQIDEGLKEKFSESEIIRSVLKMIKPGTFKDMLTNKDDLTVAELKRFLKSHMRDKSSTELFQELSNARQQDKETAQQFVYRLVGLKQKLLFASQQSGSEFNYDKKLVQGVFLHTLYQGLNDKNRDIRRDIKCHLSDLSVTDDFILEQITKAATEEAERQKRLGFVSRPKPLTVNAAQRQENSESTGESSTRNVEGEVKANRTAIMELTAQVSALAKNLEKMIMPPDNAVQNQALSTISSKTPDKTHMKPKCDECVKQGNQSCSHCFRCGQAGHRAVGCLQKGPKTGNLMRSLVRDNQ